MPVETLGLFSGIQKCLPASAAFKYFIAQRANNAVGYEVLLIFNAHSTDCSPSR